MPLVWTIGNSIQQWKPETGMETRNWNGNQKLEWKRKTEMNINGQIFIYMLTCQVQ